MAAIESAYERRDYAGLVALLQRHAADRALAAEAYVKVRDLAWNSPATKGPLGEAGAVAAVLASMRAHAAEAGVQFQGCNAQNLLVDGHAANAASARAAGAAGVVRTAMGNHPGNPGVQTWGGKILKNL